MVDIPPRLKTIRACVKRNLKAHIFLSKGTKHTKVDGLLYFTQYQPSPILAGGLEMPLKLTFKSPNFITHQKMKDFMENLYSYDYEAKAERDEDYGAEIHFMIANKDLGGEKKEDSKVELSRGSRGNPQRSLGSDCEDSEVVEPTVKRKPPNGLDTMSMED